MSTQESTPLPAPPPERAAAGTPPAAPGPDPAPGAPVDAPVDAAVAAPADPIDPHPMRSLGVLVLGLGASGRAMAAWCLQRGAQVRAWDSRGARAEAPAPTGATVQALQALAAGHEGPGSIEFLEGPLPPAVPEDVQWVLRSPGLGPADPRVAPLLQAADAAGIPVRGELDLYQDELLRLHTQHGYTPRVLAITGTNGKTTTTSLTARLVERAGRHVAVAGNIGPTLLDTLQAAVEAAPREPAKWPEVWVLELSSFQLHGVQRFAPSAAAVLNLSEDHLDWHGTMTAYAADKQRIWGQDAATVMVVNRDDAIVAALADALLQPPPPPPPATGPGGRARPAKPAPPPPPRTVVGFGLGAPRQAGDFGIVTENGMAWLVRAQPDEDAPVRRRPRPGAPAAEAEPVLIQRLMPADALRIRGRHNAANALAALALATAIGCPLAPMLHGLREYAGEPHRVQHVATVDGIDAYDDSKGTNVGATLAAITGLGADREPARLALILGGDGKGQDFSPLAEPLARHARAVALIGRDAEAIAQAVGPSCDAAGVPMTRHATLDEAVGAAFDACREGDAVLLSPACASLDMFRDYAHRAEVFVAAVQARLAERGQA